MHNSSPEAYACRARDIVLELDAPTGATDVETSLINHGDDILDIAIGLRETVRNGFLFGCLPLPQDVWSGDAVAIGSGPSLDAALPQLKEIQDTVLLVAAHSAVPRLLSAGIVPHVIAPKERDPSMGLIPKDLPASVIYGGLPCVPEAPKLCHRHWLVGTCDHLTQWLGFGRPINSPLSSGTLAATVAATVANAVYLVGHDMTMGHYAGFSMPDENEDGTIMCADGVERRSCMTYRRAQYELSTIAERHVVVQTNLAGGRISGRLAIDGVLPNAGSRLVELPSDPTWDRHKNQQLARFQLQISRIPGLMATAEQRVYDAKTGADLSAHALFHEDVLLGASMFQTIYLSMSIMKRTQKLTDEETFEATRHALLNVLGGLSGAWKEMVHGLDE